LFHNNFTKKLKSYLYSVSADKEEAEGAFVVLTTPSKRTIVADEREDFLYIYEKYRKFLNAKKITDDLKQDLAKHAEKWGHLGYIYAGNVEPFGQKHYLGELFELAETGSNSKKILNNEKRRIKIVKKKQSQLYKKLKISPLYRRLFENAKDFALSKLIRRHAQLLNAYLLHHSLLPEIAKRLGISRYQLQFMLKEEVRDALLKEKLDKKILPARLKHCVFYTEEGFEKVYLGSVEQKLRHMVAQKIDKNIKELTGQTAQPGFAKGVVKIIFRAKDMAKFNKRDILVSVATDPDVVPIMKKAAAIVTEQGGITSHAAIVSRELGIPCIIGTKIATRVFKDGDLVEVDASKGVVRKLK
ncbi:MAG: PEP-utilizing enzyme, partial [Candidatus Doudnabacteria bacterium]|nr:PEP-utilizing enzyme [Candidatus Doudnabacteria bacterium]